MVQGNGQGDLGQVRGAGFILLFAFTYLWVEANNFLNAGGRAFGWYCLFVAITAIPAGIWTFATAQGNAASIYLGVCWLPGPCCGSCSSCCLRSTGRSAGLPERWRSSRASGPRGCSGSCCSRTSSPSRRDPTLAARRISGQLGSAWLWCRAWPNGRTGGQDLARLTLSRCSTAATAPARCRLVCRQSTSVG